LRFLLTLFHDGRQAGLEPARECVLDHGAWLVLDGVAAAPDRYLDYEDDVYVLAQRMTDRQMMGVDEHPVFEGLVAAASSVQLLGDE
jgi:hypothetical protein